ncbi:MAG: Ltp family lipoprotein [Moraxella sp.]|nr:Ltp family lipoprotein [Moraxella sp.]
MNKLIKCEDCGKDVSIKATACPNCGSPVQQQEITKKEKSKATKTGCLGLIIGFCLLVATCSYMSVDSDVDSATNNNQGQTVSTDAQESQNVTSNADAQADTQDNLTAQQKNAIRSAKQYLSFQGFSRDGLIQQLSSSAGNGYDVKDATIAVDSLDVDWNEQAVKSAKNYLAIQGFSCKGLIEQLSSSAGDKFTKSQAEHGAKGAGACN